MATQTKLFVALDFQDAQTARSLVQKLTKEKLGFKVGLELFTVAGPSFVKELVGNGHEVFLDLKFHDIPNTVAQACARSCDLGVSFLNVHCGGGSEMLQAAAQAVANENAKRSSSVKLLGVTILTSLNDASVREIGFGAQSASQQVEHFIALAEKAGLDGVVCSAQELGLVRNKASSLYTMVPGIRPEGAAAHDQKRTLTPGAAAKAGASAIVVGRPITKAADPLAMAQKILAEL